MSLLVEVQKKKLEIQPRKIMIPSDVFVQQEVQEIKDAIQEHLLFIGLDNGNNIRNISLLAIGSSSNVSINCKDVVRTALTTASDKVILVHNHPSNNLQPSKHDIEMTNNINKLLRVFNIKLLDHIIVAEKDYMSMQEIKAIDKDYDSEQIKLMNNAILSEENKQLKYEITLLKNKIKKYEVQIEKDEEME